MSKKKVKQRSKVKPFLRVYNYNHIMPTRFVILVFSTISHNKYKPSTYYSYSMDVNLDKQVVNKDAFRDPALRVKARREIKAKLEARLEARFVPVSKIFFVDFINVSKIIVFLYVCYWKKIMS